MNLEYKTKYLKYKKKYLKLKEILGGAGLTEKEREKKEKEDQIRAQFAMFGKAQQQEKEDRKLTPEEQQAEEARSGIYTPPGQRAAAAVVGVTASKKPSTGKYIPPARRAAAVSATASKKPSATLIDTMDNFFKLLNDNINETDQILIIDFENIRSDIVNKMIRKSDYENERIQFSNQAETLGPKFKKVAKYILQEHEHILAWLFIIKFYALQNTKKSFDKIIVVCKIQTWDEWFDYAFSLFDDNIKNKFFIVRLDLSKEHSQLSRQLHFMNGLDDYIMYLIKHYLEKKGKQPAEILTLDGEIHNDFEKYKQFIANPSPNLSYEMTVSWKELGYERKVEDNVHSFKKNIGDSDTLLYDYNMLKDFEIKQSELTTIDWLNQYYSNYFDPGYFPKITNFIYDKVVSTVEDIAGIGQLDDAEVQEYKEKIIGKDKEGKYLEIKREDYDVINKDNFQQVRERPRFKLNKKSVKKTNETDDGDKKMPGKD